MIVTVSMRGQASLCVTIHECLPSGKVKNYPD